jgi:hypothetical protein
MPSNTCLICKRKLKDVNSIKFGMGPVCRAKRKLEENEKQGELFMVEAIPDFGDVVCSRDEKGITTNVPRRIIRHSPTGFEWGYGGIGPADFALNILSVYIGEQEAKSFYQAFKFKFIATLPHEGGTIKREDILDWIEGIRKYREEK